MQYKLKEAIEEVQRRYRVVIIATSNDSSKLPKAIRDRFQTFYFSAGDAFADAVNDRLPAIWRAEVVDMEMPYGWDTFGWDKETGVLSFSARLAIDRLEQYARDAKHSMERVSA